MGENEVEILKEDIHEVKISVAKIETTLALMLKLAYVLVPVVIGQGITLLVKI